MSRRLSREEFIERANKTHGNKYDYSKVAYAGVDTKVIIICRIHGDFLQTPYNHMLSNGCPKCGKLSCSKKTRLAAETFLKRAVDKHGDKYDYLMASYVNQLTKVCISCPTHGMFWQAPKNHMRGDGCPKCADEKRGIDSRKTTDDFIRDARSIYGDKYDYSLVKYDTCKKRVCIICPSHGKFWQSPDSHLNGGGCRKCGRISAFGIRHSKDYFISKAKEKYGNKYDYSLVGYVDCKKKVCIVCNKHGKFWQTPNMHLKSEGCLKCSTEVSGEYNGFSVQDFISRAISVHGYKYDYSKVACDTSTNNTTKKVCIICPIHGEFWQWTNFHLYGGGCYECGREATADKARLSTEEFICKAKIKHPYSGYDYSLVEYTDGRCKVKIICKKHGVFLQSPNGHLKGDGCPLCSSSKGEKAIQKWLIENNIGYKRELVFKDLRSRYNGYLRFDFYLPSKNLLIEFDGPQHFEPFIFGAQQQSTAVPRFNRLKDNDALKDKYCADNGIPLLRISYKDFKRIPEILSDAILRYRKAA